MRTHALAVALLLGCTAPAQTDQALDYAWERLVEHAPYAEGYNWPVHVAPDGRFIALHPDGTWASGDGAAWTAAPLPISGANSAYVGLVQHDGATWVLGRHTGDYRAFTIDPAIRRTRDYVTWETLGASATLPHTIFYGAASFRGALWLFGGYRDARENAEIWRSADGLAWTLVAQRAPWSARVNAKTALFRNRLYLIGGGVIDGAAANDVWSTADGVNWRLETDQIAPERPVGYSAIVFDDKIWLLGANRAGAFSNEMLVSADSRTWAPARAPWTPRGGIGAWTDGAALYITGGKYSVARNGEHVFKYSNDVWRMRKAD